VHARLTRACGAPWRGSDGDARIDVARAGDKLTTLKRAWGEACFEAYGSGDDARVRQHWTQTRRQLDETLATIQKKQSELDALKGAPSTGATPTGAAPTGPTPVVARPVTQVAVRVPPGAQPGQPLTVVIPNGGSVQAVVPAGCAPGQVFYVEAA